LLVRRHVSWRSDDKSVFRKTLIRQLVFGRLGHAEVNDFRSRPTIEFRDQNVTTFQVPMNDSLLMSMLNGLAHSDEQPQPFFNIQSMTVTLLRERHVTNKFHHEIRMTIRCGSSVIHPSNARMIHQSQRLTFGFKAKQDRT